MRFNIHQTNKFIWTFCFFLNALFLHQAQATYQIKGIRMDSIGKTIEIEEELGVDDEKVARAKNSLASIIEEGRCTIGENVKYDESVPIIKRNSLNVNLIFFKNYVLPILVRQFGRKGKKSSASNAPRYTPAFVLLVRY